MKKRVMDAENTLLNPDVLFSPAFSQFRIRFSPSNPREIPSLRPTQTLNNTTLVQCVGGKWGENMDEEEEKTLQGGKEGR